jgi:tRNA 2-thiouridine synthesizing protein E
MRLGAMSASPPDASPHGKPGPLMRTVAVNGRLIATDAEGYLLNLQDWSEDFTRAQAGIEGLELTEQHWEVIRYLREYFHTHGVQAQVRTMIRHFSAAWDPSRGSNHALHDLFPRGGPQKQGNRLAGLLRTKGEH